MEKAERILKITEQCRKLETEEEKVLPFYTETDLGEEEADAPRMDELAELEAAAEVVHCFLFFFSPSEPWLYCFPWYLPVYPVSSSMVGGARGVQQGG